MYEAPIELSIMQDDGVIEKIKMKMAEAQDNYVYECITNVGVNVDKEELIKALQYDREQYEKGYADGVIELGNRLKQGRASDLIVIHIDTIDKHIEDMVRLKNG